MEPPKLRSTDRRAPESWRGDFVNGVEREARERTGLMIAVPLWNGILIVLAESVK